MACKITVTLKSEGEIDYDGITGLMTACGCVDISIINTNGSENTIIAQVEYAFDATECISKLEREFNRYVIGGKYEQT